MKNIIFTLLFSLLAFPLSAQDPVQDSADQIIDEISSSLQELQSVSYHYSREVRQPSVGNANDFQGTLYLSFRSNPLGCIFHFENDGTKTVYNGFQAFHISKKDLTMEYASTELEDLTQYSFFLYSFLTLRNALPLIARDTSIKKEIRDSVIDKNAYWLLEFSIPHSIINNLGAFQRLAKEDHTYTMLFDKTTHLPALVIRRNHANDDVVRCAFTEIEKNKTIPERVFNPRSYSLIYREIE